MGVLRSDVHNDLSVNSCEYSKTGSSSKFLFDQGVYPSTELFLSYFQTFCFFPQEDFEILESLQ